MEVVEEEERSAQVEFEHIRGNLPRTPSNAPSDSNSESRCKNDFKFNVCYMNDEPEAG